VQCNAAGQVELKLKTPWGGGATQRVMSKVQFRQLPPAHGAKPVPATASRPRDARASGDQFRAVNVFEGPGRVGRRVCSAVAYRFVAIYLGPGSATSRRWKRQRESWQSWRSGWLRTASLAQRRTAPLRIQGGPASGRARRPFWRDASPKQGARCRRDQRTAAPDVALAIAFTSEASMNRRSIPDIRKSAEDSFAAGLFCAESVVSAIARAQGADPAPLQKAATAFCSGVARTSSTCGALTGAIMGVSFVFGRSDPGESVQPAYSAAQRLIREFEREFGSTNCQALLGGCDLDTPEGQAWFKEQRLGQRCHRFTGAAAEMAARIIADPDG